MKFVMKQTLDRFIEMTLCWLSYTRILEPAILGVQRFTAIQCPLRRCMGREHRSFTLDPDLKE